MAVGPNTLDIGSSLKGTNFSSISNYNVQSLATTAVNLILIIGTAASFFFLLWGAVQWIFSGGDKEGLEKARKKITTALIGLAILFSTFALGFLINAVFNVDIFNLCIPSLTGTACVGGGSGGGRGIECLCAGKSCTTPCFSKSDGSKKFCYKQEVSGIIQDVSCTSSGFVCEPGPCP